jgi:hypothetical protein
VSGELYDRLTPFERRATERSYARVARNVAAGRQDASTAVQLSYTYGLYAVLRTSFILFIVGVPLMVLSHSNPALLVPGLVLTLCECGIVVLLMRRSMQLNRYFAARREPGPGEHHDR